jgi:hypothetical protein
MGPNEIGIFSVSNVRNLWVPVGSFGLAILLSALSGPVPTAMARRAPQQETGNRCQTDLTNVKAELSAKKWDPVNPGQGELTISGDYDTQFNTESWSGYELAALKITLKVIDLLDNKTCMSEAFGTIQNAGKKAKKVSKDDNDVQKESFKIGNGNGFTFSDGADLNKAIANAARKVAIAGKCDQSLDGVLSKLDPASETAARAKLQKEVSATLGIHWGGQLHDLSAPCPKRWHGEVKKLEIDDKGKEQKTPFAPLPGGPDGLLPPTQQ